LRTADTTYLQLRQLNTTDIRHHKHPVLIDIAFDLVPFLDHSGMMPFSIEMLLVAGKVGGEILFEITCTHVLPEKNITAMIATGKEQTGFIRSGGRKEIELDGEILGEIIIRRLHPRRHLDIVPLRKTKGGHTA